MNCTAFEPVLEDSTHMSHYAQSVQDDVSQPATTAPSPKRPRIDVSVRVPCGACNKSFKNKHSLRNHERLDHGNGAHRICQLCSRKFKSQWLLDRHVEEVHEKKARAPAHQQSYGQQHGSPRYKIHQHTGSSSAHANTSMHYAVRPADRNMAGTLLYPAATNHEPRATDFEEPLQPHRGLLLFCGTQNSQYWITDESPSLDISVSNETSLHSHSGFSTDDSNKLTPLGSPVPQANAPKAKPSMAGCTISQQFLPVFDVKYRSGTMVPVLEGQNPRPRQIRDPRPCPICQEAFSVSVDDGHKVNQHITKHIRENEAMLESSSEFQIKCADCDVPFWNTADLEWHLKSVERYKECGFKFAHGGILCTGHHPPSIDGQEHKDHRRFRTHLFAWGHSQHGKLVRYVCETGQGNESINAPGTAGLLHKKLFRRSTGSMFSEKSQLSWLSTPGYFSTEQEPLLPAVKELAIYRTRDLASNDIVTEALDLEGDFKHDVISAFRSGQPEEVERSLNRLDHEFLDGRITEDVTSQIAQELAGIKIDATWFVSPVLMEKIRCLAILVEQRMPVPVEFVSQLAMAFRNKEALQALLAAGDYFTVMSRLVMCTFCCAISNGDILAFENMLDAGVYVPGSGPPSTIPLRPFMETLHRQHTGYRYSPGKMGSNWETDYMLAIAIDARKPAMANRLIQRGANAYNILVRAAGVNDVGTLQLLCHRSIHLQT